jgi:hypothetical protein
MADQPNIPSLSSKVDPEVRKAFAAVKAWFNEVGKLISDAELRHTGLVKRSSNGVLTSNISPEASDDLLETLAGKVSEQQLTDELNERITLIDAPEYGLVERMPPVEAHVAITDANPHGTDHAMLNAVAVLDPASADTVKDRHVSDAQGKKWEAHVDASQNVHDIGSGNSVVGTGTAQTLTNKKFGDSITLPKTQGEGIKVDVAAPDFAWFDLVGPITYKDVGVGSPVLATYRGNVRDVNFTAGDDYDIKFHIDHDWAGKDCFIHVHWSHNGTDISGSLVMNHYVTYGKGHSQAPFHAEKNITQTISSLSIANTPQYQTRIDEIPLSIAGGSASLLDTAILEPDGLILVHFDVTSIPTITGGSGKPFIHFVDIHYQSTSIGTKQKTPDFYT